MVANVFKYKSDNLILFYYCVYFVLWLRCLNKDERLLLYWVIQKNSIEF